MLTVYLAGAIQNQSDYDAGAWRVAARRELRGCNVLNPMDRDYRGKESGNERAIVEGDLADIQKADVLLAMCEKPSWGTAMEIALAHGMGKRIVAVCSSETPSPWLRYHAEVHPSISEALKAVLA